MPTVTETETEASTAASEGSVGQSGQDADEDRGGPPDRDPGGAAEQAEHDGLDEELAEDVAGARAHGHAQADLAVALRHGDEHDVHDPDAADDQGDQGDAQEQPGHEADRPLDGIDDLGEVADGEVGGLAGRDPVPLAEHAGDLVHRGRDLLGRHRADQDRVDVREAVQPGMSIACVRDGVGKSSGMAAGVSPSLAAEQVSGIRRGTVAGRASPRAAELIRNLTVVQGATRRSSWSSPMMSAPLRLRTPRTRRGTSLTYTSRPTGDPLAEELARDRLAEQADHRDVADVAVGERLALLQLLPLADPQVSRRGADEGARDPVLVPIKRPGGG